MFQLLDLGQLFLRDIDDMHKSNLYANINFSILKPGTYHSDRHKVPTQINSILNFEIFKLFNLGRLFSRDIVNMQKISLIRDYEFFNFSELGHIILMEIKCFQKLTSGRVSNFKSSDLGDSF